MPPPTASRHALVFVAPLSSPVRRKWGSKRIHFREAKEWSTEAAAADDLKWKTALKRVIQKKPDGANELLDTLVRKRL